MNFLLNEMGSLLNLALENRIIKQTCKNKRCVLHTIAQIQRTKNIQLIQLTRNSRLKDPLYGRTTSEKCSICDSEFMCEHSMVKDYSQCYYRYCFDCRYTECECRWNQYGHYFVGDRVEFLCSFERDDLLKSIRCHKEPESVPYDDCYDEFPRDSCCGRTTEEYCTQCTYPSETMCAHSVIKDYTYSGYYKGKCPNCNESLCHCRWGKDGKYILNSEQFMEDMTEGNLFYDPRSRCDYCNGVCGSCRCDGDDYDLEYDSEYERECQQHYITRKNAQKESAENEFIKKLLMQCV